MSLLRSWHRNLQLVGDLSRNEKHLPESKYGNCAKAGWGRDQLKARAKDSLEKHGGLDPTARTKLSGLLRYIDGNYSDEATFQALRKELGNAQHPAHYLAIPPMLFKEVVEQLMKSGCSKGARVIIEKPFGRDFASAPDLRFAIL